MCKIVQKQPIASPKEHCIKPLVLCCLGWCNAGNDCSPLFRKALDEVVGAI